MAKQIVVLETNPADGGLHTIKCVFWFAVPAGREVPNPGFLSAWPGASAAELSDLAEGRVREEVRHLSLPISFTAAELKASLVKAYTDRAAFLAAQPFKLQYAGVFYDPASGGWSA